MGAPGPSSRRGFREPQWGLIPILHSGSVWGCPQGPTLTGICSLVLEALPEQRLHEGALCWSRGGGRECV